MTYGTKKPDMLPMYIANITNIHLKDGYEVGVRFVRETKVRIITKKYWGKGLPLYKYDLRFESGNKYDTLYMRARGRKDLIKRIKEQYPNVIGIKEI